MFPARINTGKSCTVFLARLRVGVVPVALHCRLHGSARCYDRPARDCIVSSETAAFIKECACLVQSLSKCCPPLNSRCASGSAGQVRTLWPGLEPRSSMLAPTSERALSMPCRTRSGRSWEGDFVFQEGMSDRMPFTFLEDSQLQFPVFPPPGVVLRACVPRSNAGVWYRRLCTGGGGCLGKPSREGECRAQALL